MEQSKAKTYRVWYGIFLVVGLIGIFDLATRNIVLEKYDIDVGFAVLGAFFPLQFLFGTGVASSIATILAMILGFAPLLLVLAYFFNKKAKAAENPSEENQKGIKRAKIWVWVIGGIILAMVLLGMFFAITNSA